MKEKEAVYVVLFVLVAVSIGGYLREHRELTLLRAENARLHAEAVKSIDLNYAPPIVIQPVPAEPVARCDQDERELRRHVQEDIDRIKAALEPATVP